MKVTVGESDILKAIEPNVLEAYLLANGWQKGRQFYQGLIWHKKNDLGQKFEILVPPHKEFDDFADVMRQNMKALEVAEGRSQLDILSDLLTSLSNVEVPNSIILQK